MSKVATLWRAGRDGVGHALDKPTSMRTACQKQPTPLRLAWPMRTKCADCLVAIGAVAA